MESFRQKREHIEEQVHEKTEHLRELITDEVDQARQGLHRRPLDGGGEWDHIDPKDWNTHQLIAAKTKGYVTAANGITAAGAGLAGYGLAQAVRGNYMRATIFMGIGRGLDLLDGVVAQKTKTRSDKGAALDAGCDKGLALIFLGLATKNGTMPIGESAAHAGQQVRIFRESVIIKNEGGEPNPSREGKHGMAALWLRAGGIVLKSALEQSGHSRSAKIIDKVAHFAGIGAMYRNQQAIEGYTSERIALQSSKSSVNSSQSLQ